jgi:hypothetical protein
MCGISHLSLCMPTKSCYRSELFSPVSEHHVLLFALSTCLLCILYILVAFWEFRDEIFIDVIFHTWDWNAWNVWGFILFLISQWKMRVCELVDGLNYAVKYIVPSHPPNPPVSLSKSMWLFLLYLEDMGFTIDCHLCYYRMFCLFDTDYNSVECYA